MINFENTEVLNLEKTDGSNRLEFMNTVLVYVDITAPIYWWIEFDTRKVGRVIHSCPPVSRLMDREFTLDDFSCERLVDEKDGWVRDEKGRLWCSARTHMETTINLLNAYRYQYLKTKDKKYWYQMIQLLPNSYNLRQAVMLSYDALADIYKSRKDHVLDEWASHEPTWEFDVQRPWQYGFCDWIEDLPYSELITGIPNERR